jgi:U3 small nucleolar RNA-associated protein 21
VVQSPVIDVVAIGLNDGSVILYNLRFDELVLSFKHTQGQVNSISFLTDATLGLSLMATASSNGGEIVLWDLNQKKIWCQMRAPHNGRPISSLSFINNEPVLVSSSDSDNSIKMWLLEKGQAEPRLLRERTGHAEAPNKIRFYGGLDDPANQGARNLITCAKDGNLRDISLLNEFQSMNFSKKKQMTKVNEGLDCGPVSSFDFSQFRERDWANVLTCHENGRDKSSQPQPFLWSYANHSISKV